MTVRLTEAPVVPDIITTRPIQTCWRLGDQIFELTDMERRILENFAEALALKRCGKHAGKYATGNFGARNYDDCYSYSFDIQRGPKAFDDHVATLR
jgi:hypothetical protein